MSCFSSVTDHSSHTCFLSFSTSRIIHRIVAIQSTPPQHKHEAAYLSCCIISVVILSTLHTSALRFDSNLHFHGLNKVKIQYNGSTFFSSFDDEYLLFRSVLLSVRRRSSFTLRARKRIYHLEFEDQENRFRRNLPFQTACKNPSFQLIVGLVSVQQTPLPKGLVPR